MIPIPQTTPRPVGRIGMLLAAALVLPSASAAAPSLHGTWWWSLLETPAELRYSGGQLVGGHDFGVFAGAYEYFPTTSGTGFQNLSAGEQDERGRVTVSESRVVRQSFEGGGEAFLYLNQADDVMVGAGAGPEFAGLEILLRQPTEPFAIADLVGQWDYHYLEVPQSVSVSGQALNGGGAFGVEHNRFTVGQDGRLTITATGEPLAALAVIQGLPTVVGGGTQEGLLINRGLDVLLSVKGEQAAGDPTISIYNISLLLRRPDTVTAADIVGRWHVSELHTPTRLQLGAGPVVQGGADFGAESFSVTFLADGRLVDADGEVDSWSLTPDGLVQIGGAASGVRFAVNRSKTFGAAVNSGEDNTLTVAVKYSDDTGTAQPPTLELVRDQGRWRLVWTGGILESAPTPAGPWTPVPGASSPRVLETEGGQEFFRVRAS